MFLSLWKSSIVRKSDLEFLEADQDFTGFRINR